MIFDLYGFEIEGFRVTKEILEEALNLEFSTHHSDYYGSYYLAKLSEGGEISAKGNYDEIEHGFLEPDFQNIEILIYVDKVNLDTAREYQKKLLKISGVSFLRRDSI